MNLELIQRLARKHLGAGPMESSARACLADSIRAQERDDWKAAAMWALRSLQFSVGLCHQDFKRAQKAAA